MRREILHELHKVWLWSEPFVTSIECVPELMLPRELG